MLLIFPTQDQRRPTCSNTVFFPCEDVTMSELISADFRLKPDLKLDHLNRSFVAIGKLDQIGRLAHCHLSL